jgi:hypothetical protein
MIAQVFITSGGSDGAEVTPDVAEQIAKRQRDVPGCEVIYMMADPSTREGIAFTLWRDEASMKAGAGYQAQEIADAQKANPSMEVSAPRVYEVIASA